MCIYLGIKSEFIKKKMYLIGHQEWVQKLERKIGESEEIEWGLNNNQSLHSMIFQTNFVNPICYKTV